MQEAKAKALNRQQEMAWRDKQSKESLTNTKRKEKREQMLKDTAVEWVKRADKGSVCCCFLGEER